MCFLVDLKAALLAEARPRGKAFQKLDLPKKSRGMHGTALRRPHSPMDTAADTAADTDTAADSAGTRSHRGRDSDSVAKRSQVGSSPGSTAAGADHMRHEESVLFPARCCTCMSVSMCMCMPMWDEPPGTPHNSNSLSLSGEQGTLRSPSGKISETALCKIDRSGSGEGLSRPIIAR